MSEDQPKNPIEKAFAELDTRPLSGFTRSIAPNVVADGSRDTLRFLEEIVLEIQYQKYFSQLKVQTFEALRALAISDTFEDLPESAKIDLVRPYEPAKLRNLPEWSMILSDVEEAANRIASGETDEQWLSRVIPRTRRGLEITARSGGEKERGRAAAEILDRRMAKMTRDQGGDTKVVVLAGERLELLAKALEEKIVGEKK